MKHSIFLLSSLLAVGTAQAQVGLRAGGSLAGYRTNTNNTFRTTTASALGGQVGVFYQLRLSKRLALVPEVQYSVERFTLNTASGTFIDLHFGERIAYLNVPVLLRATFGRFYAEAGAQASRLLGGTETGQGGFASGVPLPAGGTRDGIARYQRFDVGPSAGVGANLARGLGVYVRAYLGVISRTQDAEAVNGRYYRRSVQASLTYQLPKRKPGGVF